MAEIFFLPLKYLVIQACNQAPKARLSFRFGGSFLAQMEHSGITLEVGSKGLSQITTEDFRDFHSICPESQILDKKHSLI